MTFLVGMELAVDPQVPAGVEVLPAHAAVERLVAGMRPQVEIQTRLQSKLLPTFRAGIFLLGRVCGEVTLEVV